MSKFEKSFQQVNTEETIRVTREINDLNKQIEERVEKIAKVHGIARDRMMAKVEALKQEKKIKEKLLTFDDQILIRENSDENSISLELNKWLEKKIRKNPAQWIWSHDRWK